MKLTIIAVGKNKDDFIRLAEEEYLKRLQSFCEVEMVYTPSVSNIKNQSIEKLKQIEGTTLLEKIPEKAYIIALDEHGKEYSSKVFASHLSKSLAMYNKPFYFVIGGPYGLSRKVLDHADEKLALSKLTFTHQMVRIILLEQLYRAFTIMKGKKYHY